MTQYDAGFTFGAENEQIRRARLTATTLRLAPTDAAQLLVRETDAVIADVLGQLHPAFAYSVLRCLPDSLREQVLACGPASLGQQWAFNHGYPPDSVGFLMEPPIAVFSPETTAHDAIERIRELAGSVLVTYAYVTDADGKLRGLVVMRDLMLAAPGDPLKDVMLRYPFAFRPDTRVQDAVREMVHRHYPVYPVCDADGRLLGLVHGYALFQEHAVEITAQPGRMVGVGGEERIHTPWKSSLRFRQPWLQLNLLTAFVAAAVVGYFEATIAQLVALAVFLPVLAGQSGNTGCQALAITLRGMTLGECQPADTRLLARKEALLGSINGALVGLPAALAMYWYAAGDGATSALLLALVVFTAMVGSCAASGVSGVLVPMALKRLGFDPATASTIFLTTATDVASMGLLLGLGTLLVS